MKLGVLKSKLEFKTFLKIHSDSKNLHIEEDCTNSNHIIIPIILVLKDS